MNPTHNSKRELRSLVIAVAVIISVTIAAVLLMQSAASKSSGVISGSIACEFADNGPLTAESTDFKITYTVTNNSNQFVDAKWYVSGAKVAPDNGDISTAIAPGSSKSVTIEHKGTLTKPFQTAIGAYADGGTIPGSGTGSCTKTWPLN